MGCANPTCINDANRLLVTDYKQYMALYNLLHSRCVKVALTLLRDRTIGSIWLYGFVKCVKKDTCNLFFFRGIQFSCRSGETPKQKHSDSQPLCSVFFLEFACFDNQFLIKSEFSGACINPFELGFRLRCSKKRGALGLFSFPFFWTFLDPQPGRCGF